ncbi:hypothetical protein [Bauldia litoralis]|uniref:Uncharacterized protein n=1 Tax=Bauldia litoralis TaxID=665467 RepID=A0A1G6CER1_9HYPH|nr:hypothetical protein [Bauldia litoralis]SDB31369.1 hypothetical protein SAMN02982931_02395 [Bauldia litoralis]
MPVQKLNVSGGPIGITYSGPFEVWTIAKGVSVSATDAGVLSEFASSTLVNKGSVAGHDGVYFDPDAFGEYVVRNTKSGKINAENIGIFVEDFSGPLSVSNKGKITGDVTGIKSDGSSDVSIENKGRIFGEYEGIEIDFQSMGTTGVSIDNYASIRSLEYAIALDDYYGQTAKIMNAKGATIKAPVAIYSDEQLKLTNEGKIKGDIFTYDGNDKIINKMKIVGDVRVGEGDDTIKNKGDARTTGLMDGHEGNDTFVLGNKTDKILFDSALDAATNVDRIKNFESGDDRLYLDEDFFPMLSTGKVKGSEFHKGKSAKDADDYLIYHQKTGALYYDADGSGIADKTKFAQFDAGTKLTASDIRVGEYTFDFFV